MLAPLPTSVLAVSFSHNLLDFNASAADLQVYVKPYYLSSLHARICPVLEGIFFHYLATELTLQNSTELHLFGNYIAGVRGCGKNIL